MLNVKSVSDGSGFSWLCHIPRTQWKQCSPMHTACQGINMCNILTNAGNLKQIPLQKLLGQGEKFWHALSQQVSKLGRPLWLDLKPAGIRGRWGHGWGVGSGGQFTPGVRPHSPATGFDLPRQQWSLLNRSRTGRGCCGACKAGWRLADTDLCPCRLGRCPTLSSPVLWQGRMAAYPSCTLRMGTLFPDWPIMVHDMHARRRSKPRQVHSTHFFEPNLSQTFGWFLLFLPTRRLINGIGKNRQRTLQVGCCDLFGLVVVRQITIMLSLITNLSSYHCCTVVLVFTSNFIWK